MEYYLYSTFPAVRWQIYCVRPPLVPFGRDLSAWPCRTDCARVEAARRVDEAEADPTSRDETATAFAAILDTCSPRCLVVSVDMVAPTACHHADSN